jgi:hypothetical protein
VVERVRASNVDIIKTIDESGMSINYAAATLIRPCHKKSESNEKAIRLWELVPTD